MRNFVLGGCFGFILGALCASWGWSQAQTDQPWNPYAPGSFNSSTNLYNSQISADTDNYLNSLKLQEESYRKSPCPW